MEEEGAGEVDGGEQDGGVEGVLERVVGDDWRRAGRIRGVQIHGASAERLLQRVGRRAAAVEGKLVDGDGPGKELVDEDLSLCQETGQERRVGIWGWEVRAGILR